MGRGLGLELRTGDLAQLDPIAQSGIDEVHVVFDEFVVIDFDDLDHACGVEVHPRPRDEAARFEIAARRGPSDVHGSASRRRRNPCCSIASRGSSQGVGGRISASNALSILRRLATPEAVIGWPMLPLSEPIVGFGPSPQMRASDSSSTVSPRGVPVAWHSMKAMSAGVRPACAYAERIART